MQHPSQRCNQRDRSGEMLAKLIRRNASHLPMMFVPRIARHDGLMNNTKRATGFRHAWAEPACRSALSIYPEGSEQESDNTTCKSELYRRSAKGARSSKPCVLQHIPQAGDPILSSALWCCSTTPTTQQKHVFPSFAPGSQHEVIRMSAGILPVREV